MTGNVNDNLIIGNDGNDVLSGGGGNDTLVGGSGNDVFIALAADGKHDTIVAGNGNATLLVTAGEGTASIQQSLTTDKLIFGSGMTASDVTAQVVVGASGASVVELTTSSGGSIYIENNLKTGNLRQIEFSDGSSMTLSQLLLLSNPAARVVSDVGGALGIGVVEMTLAGSAPLWAQGNELDNIIHANSGNDTLIGGSGNDTLIAGAGVDTFVGGDGSVYPGDTTFHVDVGNGALTILRSLKGDTLEFGAGIHPDDVTASDMYYGPYYGDPEGEWIRVSLANGQQIRLQVSALTYDTEVLDNVRFADGTTMSILDIQQQSPGGPSREYDVPEGVSEFHVPGIFNAIVTANNGDITITGNSAHNRLIGGAGNVTFIAGGGDTEFVAGTGENLFIARLDAHSSTFEVPRGSGDVIIKHATTTSLLVLGDGLSHQDATVSAGLGDDGSNAVRIEFANGPTITIEDNDGPSLLYAIWFDGTSTESYSLSDLLAENTHAQLSATSAESGVVPWGVLKYTLTGDADLTVTGNGLNATITGNAGHDTLKGGAGSDTLVAGTGTTDMIHGTTAGLNTTYQINGNSGDVSIDAGEADLLQFGEGITAADLTAKVYFPTSHPGLVTLIMESGAVITLTTPNDSLYVKFTDGSIVNVTSITGRAGLHTTESFTDAALPVGEHVLVLSGNDAITGTGNEGRHTIVANDAGDTLIAGTGPATLIGGAGSDRFFINSAADRIIDQYHYDDDSIFTSVDYTLPENIYHLSGTGTAHLTLTGNSSGGDIQANDYGNTLIGVGYSELHSGHGTATDTLIGSSSGAAFFINNPNTIISAQESTDNRVITNVSLTLPTHVHAMESGSETHGITLVGNDSDSLLKSYGTGETLVAGTGTAVLEQLGYSAMLIAGSARAALISSSIEDMSVQAAAARSLLQLAAAMMLLLWGARQAWLLTAQTAATTT